MYVICHIVVLHITCYILTVCNTVVLLLCSAVKSFGCIFTAKLNTFFTICNSHWLENHLQIYTVFKSFNKKFLTDGKMYFKKTSFY